MRISIAIPTYEMNGRGYEMLKRCLNSIGSQSFQNFEVVISDNSNNLFDDLVKLYPFKIKYFHSDAVGATKNTNSAIKECSGELIKILNQDDYFTQPSSLSDIVEGFTGDWQITGCNNNLIPMVTGDLVQGNNKLGSPSCLTIRNHNVQMFDENLRWVFDCDYYQRMIYKYGNPVILKGNYITIGEGDHQVTNRLTLEEKLKEVYSLTQRYA